MRRSLKDEKAALKKAVASFAKDMLARLYQKAEKGYRGWDGNYPTRDLSSELFFDAERLKDFIRADLGIVNFSRNTLLDISNRSMMLWSRANGKKHRATSPARQPKKAVK